MVHRPAVGQVRPVPADFIQKGGADKHKAFSWRKKTTLDERKGF